MDDTHQRQPFLKSLVEFVKLLVGIAVAYVEAISSIFKRAKRKSITGQNVLITGSGHGLGREMALKFAHLSTNLVLVDINKQNNDKVREEIESEAKKSKTPIKVLSYSIDLRDERQVSQLATDVKRDLGDIDILVNNAGIVQCLPFLELDPKLVERTFQVNILAHIWTIKHFLPSMIKNGRGHIVGISSIAGFIGTKYLTDYCASKFAVVGLMESLENELHDDGSNPNINLTTVCPSCMSTGMFQTFTTRLNWLLPVLRADEVADCIIEAVLKNKKFIALPLITLWMHRMSNLVPVKASQLVQQYLDYGVKPHRH